MKWLIYLGGVIMAAHLALAVPQQDLDALIAAANEIAPLLQNSADLTTVDAIYRTPAAQLRYEADQIEKRDAAITRFRKALDAVNKVQ